MKIILSPAKKMNIDNDTLLATGKPVFLEDAKIILEWMKKQSASDLQKLWKCNDRIAEQNMERLKSMKLETALTPAILSYEGIAYQYMAPSVFENGEFEYVQEHLRILSGFYGVLKPMDGVAPYRLEMQAKAGVSGAKNLYDFWGRRLYDEIRDESGLWVNLASKEYSQCIEKYLTEDDRMVSCEFVELVGGTYKVKATYAKMARGEMVRFMAVNGVESFEQLKKFNALGYVYRDKLSDESHFVFERLGD